MISICAMVLSAACAQNPLEKDHSFDLAKLVTWNVPLQVTGGLDDPEGPFLIGDVRRGSVFVKNIGNETVEVHAASRDCGCSRPSAGSSTWRVAPSAEIEIPMELVIAGAESAVEVLISMAWADHSDPTPVFRVKASAEGSEVLKATYGGVVLRSTGPPLIAIDLSIEPLWFLEKYLPAIPGMERQSFERDGTEGKAFYTVPFFQEAAWPRFEVPPVQLRSWMGVSRERFQCSPQELSAPSLEMHGCAGLGGEARLQRSAPKSGAELLEAAVWGVAEARIGAVQRTTDEAWSYELFLPDEVLADAGRRIVICERWVSPGEREQVCVESRVPVYAR